jgi:hypothetical protein|tara:strand:+ start:4102 stop:4422 length:321 start_codon:yes stop_codon:yes gene_type:complete
MNNSTIDKKIGEIKTRVDTYQGEFWDILMDLIFNPDSIITDKKPRGYYVERLKELQSSINYSQNYVREISLDFAKQQLEEAFTPHIKQLLKDKLLEQLKELDENEK